MILLTRLLIAFLWAVCIFVFIILVWFAWIDVMNDAYGRKHSATGRKEHGSSIHIPSLSARSCSDMDTMGYIL